MENVEKAINQAVENGTILGAVICAKDKTGNLDYSGAFGSRQLLPEPKPMTLDTVFSIASMTKLMTSISALQLVERNLINLDDDVTPFLPVLAKQEVLLSFTSDEIPITEERRGPITLRHLLTHSSGVGYDFLQPEINRYKKYHKLSLAPGKTIDERFGNPLLNQPGEGWAYGGSSDWAGQLVERLSGLTLDDYMKKHIWDPLGAVDITFWPESHSEEFRGRLAAMSIRDPNTGKVAQSRKPININAGLVEAAGGQGAFATMPGYMDIVHSLLVNDERLLKRQTVDIMFQPQFPSMPATKAALLKSFKHPEWAVGSFPDTGEYDWGLGGILVDGDKHPYRKKGTMLWSGAPNLVWFVDRTAGLCGVFGVQVLPSADSQVRKLVEIFEQGVYDHGNVKTKL